MDARPSFDTTAVVRRLWTEVLGEDADPDAAFLAAGGDSFRAVLLVGRLAECCDVDIDYLDVLEATSAESLAEHLRTLVAAP
jgi:hypothetical protein